MAGWIPYGRGQVAKAVAGLETWQSDSDDLARADRQRAAILTDRNLAWIPRLEAIFAEPGLHFVAFGAAHLLGEDGVVALLRRRGWTVSPCPKDDCPTMPSGR